jgi:hypothetical protein
MAQIEKYDEEAIIEKFRKLPLERKQQVFDFLDFITSRENVKNWLDFDVWALDLAKAKGFSHLTEDDVARIINNFRSSQ